MRRSSCPVWKQSAQRSFGRASCQGACLTSKFLVRSRTGLKVSRVLKPCVPRRCHSPNASIGCCLCKRRLLKHSIPTALRKDDVMLIVCERATFRCARARTSRTAKQQTCHQALAATSTPLHNTPTTTLVNGNRLARGWSGSALRGVGTRHTGGRQQQPATLARKWAGLLRRGRRWCLAVGVAQMRRSGWGKDCRVI